MDGLLDNLRDLDGILDVKTSESRQFLSKRNEKKVKAYSAFTELLRLLKVINDDSYLSYLERNHMSLKALDFEKLDMGISYMMSIVHHVYNLFTTYNSRSITAEIENEVNHLVISCLKTYIHLSDLWLRHVKEMDLLGFVIDKYVKQHQIDTKMCWGDSEEQMKGDGGRGGKVDREEACMHSIDTILGREVLVLKAGGKNDVSLNESLLMEDIVNILAKGKLIHVCFGQIFLNVLHMAIMKDILGLQRDEVFNTENLDTSSNSKVSEKGEKSEKRIGGPLKNRKFPSNIDVHSLVTLCCASILNQFAPYRNKDSDEPTDFVFNMIDDNTGDANTNSTVTATAVDGNTNPTTSGGNEKDDGAPAPAASTSIVTINFTLRRIDALASLLNALFSHTTIVEATPYEVLLAYIRQETQETSEDEEAEESYAIDVKGATALGRSGDDDEEEDEVTVYMHQKMTAYNAFLNAYHRKTNINIAKNPTPINAILDTNDVLISTQRTHVYVEGQGQPLTMIPKSKSDKLTVESIHMAIDTLTAHQVFLKKVFSTLYKDRTQAMSKKEYLNLVQPSTEDLKELRIACRDGRRNAILITKNILKYKSVITTRPLGLYWILENTNYYWDCCVDLTASPLMLAVGYEAFRLTCDFKTYQPSPKKQELMISGNNGVFYTLHKLQGALEKIHLVPQALAMDIYSAMKGLILANCNNLLVLEDIRIPDDVLADVLDVAHMEENAAATTSTTGKSKRIPFYKAKVDLFAELIHNYSNCVERIEKQGTPDKIKEIGNPYMDRLSTLASLFRSFFLYLQTSELCRPTKYSPLLYVATNEYSIGQLDLLELTNTIIKEDPQMIYNTDSYLTSLKRCFLYSVQHVPVDDFYSKPIQFKKLHMVGEYWMLPRPLLFCPLIEEVSSLDDVYYTQLSGFEDMSLTNINHYRQKYYDEQKDKLSSCCQCIKDVRVPDWNGSGEEAMSNMSLLLSLMCMDITRLYEVTMDKSDFPLECQRIMRSFDIYDNREAQRTADGKYEHKFYHPLHLYKHQKVEKCSVALEELTATFHVFLKLPMHVIYYGLYPLHTAKDMGFAVDLEQDQWAYNAPSGHGVEGVGTGTGWKEAVTKEKERIIAARAAKQNKNATVTGKTTKEDSWADALAAEEEAASEVVGGLKKDGFTARSLESMKAKSEAQSEEDVYIDTVDVESLSVDPLAPPPPRSLCHLEHALIGREKRGSERMRMYFLLKSMFSFFCNIISREVFFDDEVIQRSMEVEIIITLARHLLYWQQHLLCHHASTVNREYLPTLNVNRCVFELNMEEDIESHPIACAVMALFGLLQGNLSNNNNNNNNEEEGEKQRRDEKEAPEINLNKCKANYEPFRDGIFSLAESLVDTSLDRENDQQVVEIDLANNFLHKVESLLPDSDDIALNYEFVSQLCSYTSRNEIMNVFVSFVQRARGQSTELADLEYMTQVSQSQRY